MVSKFHKISTNSKEMEVSYIQYFSREVFTSVRNKLHIERDGLSVGQKRLVFIHSFLIVPEGIRPDVGDQVTCMNWHSRCAIQVPSIQKAIEIWDCSKKIPSNACHSICISKGILIGRKDTKLEIMPCEYEKYVKCYLTKKGILGDLNNHEWHSQMKEVKSIFFSGNLYKCGCTVVVKRDSSSATDYKAKIKKFFTHDFGGEIRVFFSANYYLHLQDEVDNQQVDLVDKITGMNVILNNRMFPFDFTCIRPIDSIICKFMKVPCSRQIGVQYSIAYTMEDLEARQRVHFAIEG